MVTLDQAARIVAEWMGWEAEIDGPTGEPYWISEDREWWLNHILSGDGMLEIKKAAAARGWTVITYVESNKADAEVMCLEILGPEDWNHDVHCIGEAGADTEPAAVLLAVARAIEATKEGAR